jgi:hypothetical protein
MSEDTTRVRSGSRRRIISRPETYLRRVDQERWALVDGEDRAIVADGSAFEPVRR